MHNRTASTASGLAFALAAAAAGASFAACTSAPMMPTPLNCATDTDGIQRDILAPSCGTAGCHAAENPSSRLDLASPGLEARLVNARSNDCPGNVLLVPGDPDNSLLLRKVNEVMPPCGQRMPLGMNPLTLDQLQCLRNWVMLVPPSDASPPGTDAATDAPPDGPAPGCPSGETMCGGACVDTQTSAANCGMCGHACATGTVCTGGMCIRGSCPSGTTDCSGSCVSTQTSNANCGTCGHACPAGSTCMAGTCTCGSGQALCGGSCVDTQSSNTNCGTCGHACASGTTCMAGTCMSCGPMVSFGSQIQPIFTATCLTAACHGTGPRPAGNMSLAAGSAYSQLVNVHTSDCSGSRVRVTPGSVPNSYLVNKLTGVGMCSGSRMPGGAAAPLSDAQMNLIRGWICNGAPNN